MSARTYCTVSAVVYAVVAIVHLVRAVQATPDFGGELSLRIGITGR